MRKLLGGRGGRLAVVMATAAAALSGPPAQAVDTIVTMTDPTGDAHVGTFFCSIDCSGAPAPVSEPSVDIRRARVDRIGSDLVYEFRVVDLDHEPVPAQPEDTVGYNLSLHVGAINFTVVARRTAAHAPTPSYVTVSDDANNQAQRAIPAPTFDHAADTVRARLPLAVLNDAIDDVCASCHVDGASTFEHPFLMAYLLVTTPGGPTGPVYQDLVRETPSRPLVPTQDGLPNWYYGGGPFTGTLDFHPASAECGEAVPVTMSITANVALSNGTSHYAGPVTLSGRGCGNGGGMVIGRRWSVHGTDVQGRTLDCPELSGMGVQTVMWVASFGGPCTLDGIALPRANPAFFGEYAPTGIDTDLAISSGTVVGVLSFSAFGESS